MIECRDLTKTYQTGNESLTVLHGVSFSIPAGAFVAIMGASGSGKSTLMHILGTLDRPTSGTYVLDGQEIDALADDALAEVRSRMIGFVFQAFYLLPRATVLRNVMLPLVYDRSTPIASRRGKVERALEQAGFPRDRWNHTPSQLSGGQMQRVAIARALVNGPSMILADEPTGNLDSATGAIVLETLQTLNREHGKTIILITHEHAVAARANRIIEVRDGSLVADTIHHR